MPATLLKHCDSCDSEGWDCDYEFYALTRGRGRGCALKLIECDEVSI